MNSNASKISNKLSEVSVVSFSILMFSCSVFLIVTLGNKGFLKASEPSLRASMIQEKVAEIEDVEKLRNLSILLAGQVDGENSVTEELAGALRTACYMYAGLSLIQLINVGCLVFARRKDRGAGRLRL